MHENYTPNVARIAFVTRRFHELQGLIPAAFGGALILGSLLMHAVRGPDNPGRAFDAFQAFMFAGVSNGPLAVYVQRIYRRTFGAPVATRYQSFLGVIPMVLVIAGGTFDLMQISGKGGPSFAAIGVAIYATYVVSRDWQWRTYHLVVVAAGLVAAAVTASVPASADRWGADPARSAAYLLAYTIIGLGLIVGGLLDHQLLSSSLHRTLPRAAPETSRRQSYPHYGLMRAWIGGVFCAAAGTCLVRFSDRVLPEILPAGLLLALTLIFVLPAIPQLWRAVRDFGKRVTESSGGPTVDFRTDSLALMFLIAIAAAIDSAASSPASPRFLAVAIACGSLWVAVRDWPLRGYYVIGVAASIVVVFYIPHVQSARAFAILIFAATGSVMVEGILDFWNASTGETAHAETV